MDSSKSVETNHTIDETIDPSNNNLDSNGIPIVGSETVINSQASLPTSDIIITFSLPTSDVVTTDEGKLPESQPASPKTESKW